MKKSDIAVRIAEDMLDNGMLDEQNYNYDTGALVEDVKNMILEHLKDYLIIAGTTLN